MNDFLYLLRCALWNTKPELSELDDWNGVVRMAQRQTVFGLVVHAVLQTEAVGQLAPESRKLLQQQMDDIIHAAKQANSLVVEIINSFSQEGIDTFLLKGQGLAAFYPNPELRQCGDIDLLVTPKDYEQAMVVLNRMVSSQSLIKAYTTEKHYHITIKGIPVELHWSCMVFDELEINNKYKLLEEHGLKAHPDDFFLGGTCIHRLSATFNVFYVFLHLWEHFLERGIGLRQICDLAMLLHRRNAQIDRNLLCEQLETLELWYPWKLFGCMIVCFLGLPSEEMPFYDAGYTRKAKRLLGIVLKEGNFGNSMNLNRFHKQHKGVIRSLTTLVSIQVRSWRIFTLLPNMGWSLWKQKMKGGFNK